MKPKKTNPTNPAFAPTKTHAIEDTLMRVGEFWTRCICGALYQADDAEQLASRYADHIAAHKR